MTTITGGPSPPPAPCYTTPWHSTEGDLIIGLRPLCDRHCRGTHLPLHRPRPRAPTRGLRRPATSQERSGPRRLRRHCHEGRPRINHGVHACRAASVVRSPGTEAKSCQPTHSSRSTPASRSSSPIRTRHGSAPPTRTPTDCSANTSPGELTFPVGVLKNSSQSRTPSTTDPARSSAGRPPPKPSTNNFGPSDRQVLQRLVEPGQYTSIRYTERLAEIGATPSIGSVADSTVAPWPRP
jgi:hypothetical protein